MAMISCFWNAPDSNDPFGPSFHSILSALRPLNAAHVLSAITATPPSGWKFTGPFGGSSLMTCRTPFTASAPLSSRLFTEPRTTGGCSIDAYTMPSRKVSRPKDALPVVMSFRS